MAVFDIFSKRQKKLRGDLPDVYQYATIPEPLRVQIVHIWQDTLGDSTQYREPYFHTKRTYSMIVEALCREYGVFSLVSGNNWGHGDRNFMEELATFLLTEGDTEKVLDAVEISFRTIFHFLILSGFGWLNCINCNPVPRRTGNHLDEAL